MFDRLRLRGASGPSTRASCCYFLWIGERRHQALVLALIQAELEPAPLGIAVGVSADKEAALIAALGDELLDLAWLNDRVDVDCLPALAARLLASLAPTWTEHALQPHVRTQR